MNKEEQKRQMESAFELSLERQFLAFPERNRFLYTWLLPKTAQASLKNVNLQLFFFLNFIFLDFKSFEMLKTLEF